MSNASTIRRQVAGTQQLTLAPITSLTTTTETAFVFNNNALTGVGGGIIPLTAGVTGLYAGTGQVIHVRAAGSYSGVTAGTTTLLIKLYEVPAAVIAAGGLTQTSFTGYNVLVTPANPITLTNAAGAFTFDAWLQMDASFNLNGTYEFTADTTGSHNPQGPAAVTSNVTGLVGEADLNFVLSVTLGGSEPSSAVYTLNEFAIDLQ